MATYEALVKLALFCANQARTSVMKDPAREAWRLAVEYQGQAANLGEPPDLGRKPRHIDRSCGESRLIFWKAGRSGRI